MSEAKHTAGPWRENGCLIEGPKMGLQVAQVQYRAVGDNIGFASKSKAEAFANARLIAAAPELLKALKFARERLIAVQESSEPIIEAALSKAEPRS